MTALLAASGLQAQEKLVQEALQYFPPQTIHLEYSSPAQLRKLPNYSSLRARYLGPQLRKLEQSLTKLGIQESDVDVLVLGWRTGGAEPDSYGLAEGRFDAKRIAQDAASAGFAPAPIAGLDGASAYCLSDTQPPDSGGTCVMVLSDSTGAFGSRQALASMLRARRGSASTAAWDERLKALASEEKSETPIWGVAVGPAIAQWFKNSMPGQDSLELDWSQAFAGVQALAYRINAADQVHLDLELECATPGAASSLRQLLDGLKGFQQLAWPSQHPNQPNPFQAVEVDSAGQRVNLKLTTPYPSG